MEQSALRTWVWHSCDRHSQVRKPPGSEVKWAECSFIIGTGCRVQVSQYQSIKIKPTNMYIASARAQFSINTHRCWNWHPCIPDVLSVVQYSLGHIIAIVFLHNFGGIKLSCWTTGSWRSCLSLEVVSSIPAGSMIIYRFLCGFICVSLCQSIKLKPTDMCVCVTKFKTHFGRQE